MTKHKPHRRSEIIVPQAPKWHQLLVAWLVWALVNTISSTIRYRIHDPHGFLARTDIGQTIYCIWHNRLALCMDAYFAHTRPRGKENKLAALISASKDGAFLAAILERFGVQPVRGSSSRRGAQALRELTGWARKGFDLAITPDGPRGPCYVQTAGAVRCVRRSP